ncbi:uncharacterized protein LOC120215666 [Hibiscus syriacus]|uniref:uncharacterized protein LOC120215666 n=1 Tax=Hibiscus syriacus TaxID=106335 RepID=UPI0019220512|nr:uncharacterized protein LOC120215666 [Hibiscus syriacus]
MVGSKEEAVIKVGGMVIDDNDDNDEIETTNYFGDSVHNINPCKNTDNYNNQPTGSRRERARASRKCSSPALNHYEFFYYSRFGPSWQKKRRGGSRVREIMDYHIEVKNNRIVVTVQNNSAMSSSSQIDDNEEFDYVDEEDEENGDSGKKRMKKPIKARSLKSLL